MNIVIYIVTYTKQERRHCLIYKKTTAMVYIQSIQLLIYIYIFIYLCPPSSINKIHLFFSLKIGLVQLNSQIRERKKLSYNGPTKFPPMCQCYYPAGPGISGPLIILRLMYEWYHHVPSYFLLTIV